LPLTRRLRLPALFCAAALLLCELISRPFAPMGIVDDGPYILMAQHVANTGHIAYNGWAAPMIGWQLYLAAAFIKLFGFSNTTVRMTTLLVAMLLAFFLQRILVRAGISERNATIATLALVLSPLYLMLSAIFMTDISGFFAVVLCLYGCIRALQASTSRATIAWLCFAIATNTVFGTSRQIAWLGALVMVPSTLWLLRAQRRVLIAGIAATLAGVLFIFACMQWLKHQPYLLPEHLLVKPFPIAHTVAALGYLFADIPFLLLPILALFLPEIRKTRPAVLAFISLFCVAYLLLVFHWRHIHPNLLLEPTMRDWVNIHGIFEGSSLQGDEPIFLHRGIQFLLTIASLGGLIGLIASLLRRRPTTIPAPLPETISWRQLGILLLPFTLAYTLLLAPRAAAMVLYDRYAFALLLVVLLCAVRYFQQRVHFQLPFAGIALVALMALCAVAMTHNNFAFYRARAALAAELRAAGVPDTSVDNGWEYNSTVQIQHGNYVNDSNLTTPHNAYIPTPPPPPGTCPMHTYDAFPQIHPLFGISFDPNACYGRAPFAPIHYSRWLASEPGTLYVVRYTPPSPR
jgi:hypothetical protein